MTSERYVQLLDVARVATLGTVTAGGRSHLVPIVFARDGARLITAVDHKPKRTTRLQRLANIEANPAVTVLAHHYSEDWAELWWVRVDGTARLVEPDSTEHPQLTGPLLAKYEQYAGVSLGTAICIDIERTSGWRASSG
jgi:PPOX class probable F420-dependent enzyme